MTADDRRAAQAVAGRGAEELPSSSGAAVGCTAFCASAAECDTVASTRGTVFFDYDGTLHDCMRLYGPAFRTAYAWLVNEGWAEPREFTDEWIGRWLGWQVRDMWEAFMPELPEGVWRQASRIVGEEMDRLLDAGEGALFPGVPEALDALKDAGYGLVFLSNCGEVYRDRHRRAFGLDRWIDAYYCAGAYPGLEKWEIYERVALRHAQPHLMVGDRFHDIDVAVRAGIPSIGCAFGFGAPDELDRATVTVARFADVPAAVERLIGGPGGAGA